VAQALPVWLPPCGAGDGTRAAAACAMATTSKNDPLTIPLLVVIWTTLLCAFIMTLVVLLMR
jgi:hypothetical protein